MVQRFIGLSMLVIFMFGPQTDPEVAQQARRRQIRS
jgi:hypothetical protein